MISLLPVSNQLLVIILASNGPQNSPEIVFIRQACKKSNQQCEPILYWLHSCIDEFERRSCNGLTPIDLSEQIGGSHASTGKLTSMTS